MTIFSKHDLILITVFTAIFALVILLSPDNLLRIIFGLPFVLFFPGYMLIAALFPKRKDIDGVERLALSFSLSIAIVPLLGFGLNYTPWGIQLYSMLITIVVFVITMCAITWLRRRKVTLNGSYIISCNHEPKNCISVTRLDKALIMMLGLTLLSSTGILYYLTLIPRIDEKFTEFYVLGFGGKAADYPRKITDGEQVSVIMGVVNHEGIEMDYRLEVVVHGAKTKQLVIPKLADKQKWEQEVDFSPSKTIDNQKVKFLLYKGDDTTFSQELHLWIKVLR